VWGLKRGAIEPEGGKKRGCYASVTPKKTTYPLDPLPLTKGKVRLINNPPLLQRRGGRGAAPSKRGEAPL